MTGPDTPNSSLLDAIQRLKEATQELPSSTPNGTSDGIVWRNFSTKPTKIEGSIFEKIDQAYTRCFSHNPSSSIEPIDNVLRGRFGMDIVIRFFEGCSSSPRMDSGALHLTELKVNQLTDLVYARINAATNPRKRKRGVRTSGQARKLATKPQDTNDDKDENDPDFEPQATPKSDLSISDAEGAENNTYKEDLDESEENRTGEEEDGIKDDTEKPKKLGKKRGPQGVARQWAFSNYETPEPTKHPDTGKPIWLLKCKHCNSIRRFQRTHGCSEFPKERQHISATNLVAHLNKCTRLPAEQTLKAVKARLNHPSESEMLTPAQASLASVFRSSASTPVLPLVISNSLFCSTLIQGVVRDNYPLTFGEGPGMRQVFALTSPHFKLPSHQTMRTDLDKLYEFFKARVLHLLKSQDSRFVVTSDAWTSKTFAYSLGGVVITFIDKSWNYQEFVLDVVHLDADHTGAGMGRRFTMGPLATDYTQFSCVYRNFRRFTPTLSDQGAESPQPPLRQSREGPVASSGRGFSAEKFQLLYKCSNNGRNTS